MTTYKRYDREGQLVQHKEEGVDMLVPNGFRFGDKIDKLVKPFARTLRLSCLDENGNLRPESRCAKSRDQFNAVENPKDFARAIFDRFRSS